MPDARQSFADQAATYLESWPSALAALSIPHHPLLLTPEERDALSVGFSQRGAAGTRAMEELRRRLGDALATHFPDGAFLRLGSRSPKDLLAVAATLRIRTAGQALLALERSGRVRVDCALARTHSYLPTVFLREWRTIPAGTEFRGFMQARRLVGLCPYHARSEPHPLPAGLDLRLAERLLREFFPRLAAVSPLDSVVFDTYLHADPQSPDGWAVTLIEINPFAPQTDAVLFSWQKPGDFDGSFRVNN